MTVEPVAPTLLDEFTPNFEFALREHVLVTAGPARADEILRRFSVSPSGLFGWLPPVPMRPCLSAPGFDELLAHGRWTVLGHRPGEGVVLGAAGRFWTAFSDWQPIAAEEFATYARPRRATIAIAITHTACGPRSLLTFEARATTTDAVAYRWADWYWHTIRPTARLVIREVLSRASR